MSFPEIDILTSLVVRVFRVEDVTMGDSKQWIVRYRGQLLTEDSAAAYDRLAESLKPYSLTPIFRRGDRQEQTVYLTRTPPAPNLTAKPVVNLLLFIITIFSVMLMGVDVDPNLVPADPVQQMLFLLRHIFTGWPFALSMLGILLAHEMGHYLACRYYKIPATLPFFLPAPFLSPLGTLGAFIMMRGTPKNKRILFDVGVAGPLAGLVIAVPVLFLGLSLSPLGPIGHAHGGFLEGNSLFYLFAKYLSFGRLLPEPLSTGGLPVWLYWLRYFFTGRPIPFGGMDVQLHSVALAGWAGLLVTALNLVPVGTLDGGHVAYGLFGDKARKAFPFVIGIMIVLTLFSFSWALWTFILLWLGRVRSEPLDDITPLDPPRRAIGYFVLVVFVLVFAPIPMTMY